MERLTEETNFGVIKDHNSLIVFSVNSPELAETLNVFDVEDYPVNEAAVLKALSNNAYTHYYRSSVTPAQRHPITHTLPYLFNSLVFPIILCVLPLVYKSLSLYFLMDNYLLTYLGFVLFLISFHFKYRITPKI